MLADSPSEEAQERCQPKKPSSGVGEWTLSSQVTQCSGLRDSRGDEGPRLTVGKAKGLGRVRGCKGG